MTNQEAMKLARDLAHQIVCGDYDGNAQDVLEKLDEALAKQEQGEPVKIVQYNCTCGKTMKFESEHGVVAPKREWVGLTDEEQISLLKNSDGKTRHWLVWQVEAKLKEKNT